jgi:hypothetical protein
MTITSVYFCETTRSHIPEGCDLHTCRPKNVLSNTLDVLKILIFIYLAMGCWGSSVSSVWLEDERCSIPGSLLYNGYPVSFSGCKERPGRDADHSPKLVPRSRMSRGYIFSPLSACMACSGTALFALFYFTLLYLDMIRECQEFGTK